MNTVSDLYQIDGEPLLAPDEGVSMSFEDLDAADAGRDAAGFMHRSVVRYKVGVWNFQYSHLTHDEYAYMRSRMPQSGTFTFTYPDPCDHTARKSCKAYLSGFGVTWHSARTNTYRNLKFSIIEC